MNFTPALLTAFLAVWMPWAVAQDVHLVGSGSWTQQPLSPFAMEQRIHRAALEYQQYGQVSRIGLFDIAFPKDAEEYAALDGFGVVLVAVLTQDREELPPKRVFVRNASGITELKMLTSAFSAVPASSLTARVLGPHRWEGLYLLPVFSRAPGAELVLDYRINRSGFVLDRFKPAGAEAIAKLPVAPPTREAPDEAAVTAFVKREFPGFARPGESPTPSSAPNK